MEQNVFLEYQEDEHWLGTVQEGVKQNLLMSAIGDIIADMTVDYIDSTVIRITIR